MNTENCSSNISSGTKLVIGHRGSSVTYPENTMLAFRQAVKEGAHGIEADVRKTNDGEYIIMHDPTVDRTTRGSGQVRDLEGDHIRALDAGGWKNAKFEGREDTKVPALQEVLDEFQDQPIFISLQCKCDYMDVIEIVDILDDRGMLDQCFIFTNKNILGDVKAYNDNAFVMNDGMRHDPEKLLKRALSESWNAISSGIDHIDKSIVPLVNEAELYLQVSYISGICSQKTQEMIDLGVDFILGDDPKTMVQVANAKGIVQKVPGEL